MNILIIHVGSQLWEEEELLRSLDLCFPILVRKVGPFVPTVRGRRLRLRSSFDCSPLATEFLVLTSAAPLRSWGVDGWRGSVAEVVEAIIVKVKAHGA